MRSLASACLVALIGTAFANAAPIARHSTTLIERDPAENSADLLTGGAGSLYGWKRDPKQNSADSFIGGAGSVFGWKQAKRGEDKVMMTEMEMEKREELSEQGIGCGSGNCGGGAIKRSSSSSTGSLIEREPKQNSVDSLTGGAGGSYGWKMLKRTGQEEAEEERMKRGKYSEAGMGCGSGSCQGGGWKVRSTVVPERRSPATDGTCGAANCGPGYKRSKEEVGGDA